MPLLSGFFLVRKASLVRLGATLTIFFFPSPCRRRSPHGPYGGASGLKDQRGSRASASGVPARGLSRGPSGTVGSRVANDGLAVFFFIPYSRRRRGGVRGVRSTKVRLHQSRHRIVKHVFKALGCREGGALYLFSVATTHRRASSPSGSLNRYRE